MKPSLSLFNKDIAIWSHNFPLVNLTNIYFRTYCVSSAIWDIEDTMMGKKDAPMTSYNNRILSPKQIPVCLNFIPTRSPSHFATFLIY